MIKKKWKNEKKLKMLVSFVALYKIGIKWNLDRKRWNFSSGPCSTGALTVQNVRLLLLELLHSFLIRLFLGPDFFQLGLLLRSQIALSLPSPFVPGLILGMLTTDLGILMLSTHRRCPRKLIVCLIGFRVALLALATGSNVFFSRNFIPLIFHVLI